MADRVGDALKNGFSVIACVGELPEEKNAKQTIKIVLRQIEAIANKINDHNKWKNVVIAYEPVWAIDTEKAATAQEVCKILFFCVTILNPTFPNHLLFTGSRSPCKIERLH